jgi:hypothetical protein
LEKVASRHEESLSGFFTHTDRAFKVRVSHQLMAPEGLVPAMRIRDFIVPKQKGEIGEKRKK